MVWIPILIIIVGFIFLSKASGIAIKRLLRLSHYFGMSEFIISFILVGFITILPELSIGINSAIQGASSFGLGILFGSNIADLSLVMGLVAVFSNGIKIKTASITQTKGFLIWVSLPVILLLDGVISRIDGFILIGAFLVYLAHMFITNPNHLKKRFETKIEVGEDFVILAISLAIVMLSGNYIASASRELSLILSLPLLLIGIVVAIGTCLPELIFAITAVRKHHTDLGFGNIIGNVFADAMLSIGIIAVISPIRPTIWSLALIDGVIMILFSILAIQFFSKQGRITRVHGVWLVMAYVVFLILQMLFGAIY